MVRAAVPEADGSVYGIGASTRVVRRGRVRLVRPQTRARRRGMAPFEGRSGRYGTVSIIASDVCPTPGNWHLSLAHELGCDHIDGRLDAMFARGRDDRIGGKLLYNGTSQLERRLNWFASELLVPDSQLDSRINSRASAPSAPKSRRPALDGLSRTRWSMRRNREQRDLLPPAGPPHLPDPHEATPYKRSP